MPGVLIPPTGGGGGGGGDFDLAGGIHGASLKATPVDGDELSLADSAASFALKKASISGVKALIKSYLDGTGIAKLATARAINGVNFDGTAGITINAVDSTARVPATRTVNGHALTSDVVVSASDLTTGTLPAAQLPSIAIVDYAGDSASQAAMLALSGQKGDWSVRTDLGTVFVIIGTDPTQLSSWKQLSYPTAPVSSVAGRTGAVTLTKTDVGLGNVDNTADSGKSVASAAALATSRNIDGQAFDGTSNVTVIAPGTHAATGKTTPISADEIPLVDSAASNVLKKVTFANFKAALAIPNVVVWATGSEPSLSGVPDGTLWVEYTP